MSIKNNFLILLKVINEYASYIKPKKHTPVLLFVTLSILKLFVSVASSSNVTLVYHPFAIFSAELPFEMVR